MAHGGASAAAARARLWIIEDRGVEVAFSPATRRSSLGARTGQR